MLKKLVSISLIVAILTTLVRFATPYLWYYSNHDYIAQELCVNRHNPEADCDGKCQLKKMVQKQHDHDDRQAAPPEVQEQRVNLFFSQSLIIPFLAASFTSPLLKYRGSLETLWFEEPLSPPPQA